MFLSSWSATSDISETSGKGSEESEESETVAWCRLRSIGTQVVTIRHAESQPVFYGGQRYALKLLGIFPADSVAEVEEIMTKKKDEKTNVSRDF